MDAESITEDECWDLLRSERIGRFALATGRGPQIFPVNYLVEDGILYFRTGPGRKSMEAWAHPRAAFEVDGRSGDQFWSVALEGDVRILDAGDPALARLLDELVSLHPSPKHMVIRFAPDLVSGRRFIAPQRTRLWA